MNVWTNTSVRRSNGGEVQPGFGFPHSCDAVAAVVDCGKYCCRVGNLWPLLLTPADTLWSRSLQRRRSKRRTQFTRRGGNASPSGRLYGAGGQRPTSNAQLSTKGPLAGLSLSYQPNCASLRRERGDDFFETRITAERVVPRQQFQSAVSDVAG